MKKMDRDGAFSTLVSAIAAHHGFVYSEAPDLTHDASAPRTRTSGAVYESPSGRLANTGTILQEAENRLRVLFIAGLDGDPNAYRDFLQALTRHLRGYLRRRIPQHRDDVEDLVQDILLAVHNARHTYRTDEPLTAWLHAIARYKLMDYFRSRARRESLNDPIDDYADLLAVSDDEPAQARRDIGKLLEALPDKQRLPIVHMKLEGLSVMETARITGLSESAVKVGVHRGLKALAARLRGLR